MQRKKKAETRPKGQTRVLKFSSPLSPPSFDPPQLPELLLAAGAEPGAPEGFGVTPGDPRRSQGDPRGSLKIPG